MKWKSQWETRVIHEGKIKKLEPVNEPYEYENDRGYLRTAYHRKWDIVFADGTKTPAPIYLNNDTNLTLTPGKTYQLIERHKPEAGWDNEHTHTVLQEKKEE